MSVFQSPHPPPPFSLSLTQTDRLIDRQAGRQAGRQQADRQTDR